MVPDTPTLAMLGLLARMCMVIIYSSFDFFSYLIFNKYLLNAYYISRMALGLEDSE